MRFSMLSLLFLLLSFGVSAEVVPDGSTSTSVTKNADGVERVVIATANSSGISHNRYQQFDVSEAGVQLDNRLSLASNIVNQVTSNKVSLLEGNVRVLGAKAHVYVVNPNGIIIDGASFTNTANLLLTTGQINYVSRTVNVGGLPTLIKNPQFITSKGRIEIGKGGLSGDMQRLDLLAKELKLNGKVRLLGANSRLSLYQGSSSYEYTSSLSINDAASSWNGQLNVTPISHNELSIDITSQANVRAGSLYIVVNDKGAGVKNAGNLYADAGHLVLHSKGHVDLLNGQLKAKGNVLVTADSLRLKGETRQASIISEQGGVVLKTQHDMYNLGGLIQARKRIAGNANSLGAVTLNIQGDFVNHSLSEQLLGVVFAQADNLSLTVAGHVRNLSGRLLSNQGLTANIGGDLYNQMLRTEVAKRGLKQHFSTQSKPLWYWLFLRSRKTQGYQIDFGQPKVAQQDGLILSALDLTLSASNIYNQGGNISLLQTGVLRLNAKQVVNQALRTGTALYRKSCVLLCDENVSSTVQRHGGKIQGAGRIEINASEQLINLGGDIIPNKGLVMRSPNISFKAIKQYRAVQRNRGLRGLFFLHDGKLVADDIGAGVLALNGVIKFISANPIQVYGGYFNHSLPLDTGRQKVIYHYPPVKGDPHLVRQIGVLSDFL